MDAEDIAFVVDQLEALEDLVADVAVDFVCREQELG